MPLFIAGLFRDRGQAERVVTSLLGQGVPSGEISLAVREQAEEDMTDRNALSDGAQFDSLATHSAWERLGWQGGARPAYRDKVAPNIEMAFIAAGPLAIAIGGAQLGAAAGGMIGTMNNFGFPLELGRRWYHQIVDGRAWLMVRTDERGADTVRKVFEKYQPEHPAESLRRW